MARCIICDVEYSKVVEKRKDKVYENNKVVTQIYNRCNSCASNLYMDIGSCISCTPLIALKCRGAPKDSGIDASGARRLAFEIKGCKGSVYVCRICNSKRASFCVKCSRRIKYYCSDCNARGAPKLYGPPSLELCVSCSPRQGGTS